MRSIWFHVAAVLLFLTLHTSCSGPENASDGSPPESVISWVERWGDSEIENPQAAPEVPPKAELRFDGTGVEAEWKVLQGIDDLKVEDGRLVGRSSSDAPIIAVDFAAPQGIDDELWSVEIRLATDAGNRVALHTVLEPGPPLPAVVGRIEEWPLSSPLVPNTTDSAGEATTYSVVLDNVFLLEMPLAQRSIQRLLIRPTNVPDANFSIESARLVFRKERLAAIDSGPGWHGLGEIFRETLVSRAPETLKLTTRLPPRPWLHLAVGTIDSKSPLFRVEVAEGGEVTQLAQLEAEREESWHSTRLDLGPWAGKEVELRLTAEGPPGSLAFWGAPTVRSTREPETPTAGASTVEDSTVEASKASDPSQPPQTVVLFIADTLRSDHLQAWGYDRETAPTLARLAGEGTRFANTIAQATWTKVSVSSILTSLYPSTTGVANLHDRISVGETTLAEVFREAGFATFATSSVPFSGQLTNLHQGVEVMYEFGARTGTDGGEYRSKTAKAWVDAYLKWLDEHQNVPTFALIHAMDAHSPFQPAAPYDSLWASPEQVETFEAQAEKVRPVIKNPLLQRFLAPTRAELAEAGVDAQEFVRHEKAWYDGSIRGMDDQVARLFQQLEKLGLKERSLFAFVADHGEEFLEHGEHWHGRTVYGEVANVPMMLWGQGVAKGRVIDEVSQTIDLMPTLIDLAGLSAPERIQGRSWVPKMRGEDLRAKPAFVEHPAPPKERTSYAIVEQEWKLVWYPGEPDTFELFDRAQDPLDSHDLAAQSPELVERMAADLKQMLSWAGKQRLAEEEVTSEMSAEQLEQLRSLGYVE